MGVQASSAKPAVANDFLAKRGSGEFEDRKARSELMAPRRSALATDARRAARKPGLY
jgi:hypothetical protein